MIEEVVVETLETAPDNATDWSTLDLFARHGWFCHQTVAEIWRAFLDQRRVTP